MSNNPENYNSYINNPNNTRNNHWFKESIDQQLHSAGTINNKRMENKSPNSNVNIDSNNLPKNSEEDGYTSYLDFKILVKKFMSQIDEQLPRLKSKIENEIIRRQIQDEGINAINNKNKIRFDEIETKIQKLQAENDLHFQQCKLSLQNKDEEVRSLKQINLNSEKEINQLKDILEGTDEKLKETEELISSKDMKLAQLEIKSAKYKDLFKLSSKEVEAKTVENQKLIYDLAEANEKLKKQSQDLEDKIFSINVLNDKVKDLDIAVDSKEQKYIELEKVAELKIKEKDEAYKKLKISSDEILSITENKYVEKITKLESHMYFKEFDSKAKLEEQKNLLKVTEENYSKKLQNIQTELNDKELRHNEKIERNEKFIEDMTIRHKTEVAELNSRFDDTLKRHENEIAELNLKFNDELNEYENVVIKREKTIEDLEAKLMETNEKIHLLSNKLCLFNSVTNPIYDVNISFKSFSKLNEGFHIDIFDTTLHDKYKKENRATIGILGTYKVGKSFLASKLTCREITRGHAIDTEGLDIIYHNEFNCIDTLGLNKAFIDNISDVNQINNNINDKAHTENLIKEFVVKYADVLIIVVGKLTTQDQVLIDDVIRFNKNSKKILVVHNLYTITDLKEFEDYTLSLMNTMHIEKETFSGNDKFYYFKELRKDGEITHFTIGRELEEDFNQQNNIVFKMISNIIKVTDKKRFDPSDSFLSLLRSYINTEVYPGVINKELKHSNGKYWLSYEGKLELESTFVFGRRYKENSNTPNYKIYQDKYNNYIIVEIEVANPDIDSIISDITMDKRKCKVSIRGKKKPNTESLPILSQQNEEVFALEFVRDLSGMVISRKKPPIIKAQDGYLNLYYSYED
jgi:hypothetical protein